MYKIPIDLPVLVTTSSANVYLLQMKLLVIESENYISTCLGFSATGEIIQ